MQPLSGMLVVDFSRYLPGAFASRELLELGARVVCVEPPGGDPMRSTAPTWDAALRAGKESIELDLKQDATPALELLREADVVLESFRPGVTSRLGIGPEQVPERTVYCSITGFGLGGRHEQRAGHDLNYLGWAGALADTTPAWPPVQIADLAAGALGAVTKILVAHRLGGETPPRMLTGGLACYRIYETADGRHLTLAALEPAFFRRLTELLGQPELAGRQFDSDQEALATELAAILTTRPLAEWLELFDAEDVCVGPVATLAEAASDLG
jgi:alpha-methylacyl-CoA racemase